MHNKIGQDRAQMFCTSLDDYVELDNSVRELERLVTEIVTDINLPQLRGYSKVGCRAYSATELLCLHLYGYINGITSSRQLERAARINKEVCWLLKNNQPSYKTIADFRKDNSELIEKVFYGLVHKLAENEYITGNLVVLDGNKTKANAMRNVYSAKHLKQQIASLEKDAEAYMQDLAAADKRDTEVEVKSDSDKPEPPSAPNPQDVKQKLLATEAKLLKKQEILTKMESAQLNYLSPTDEDSSLVISRRGMVAGYNPQYTVDEAHHMIIDVLLSTDANDTQQLYRSMQHLVQHTAIVPGIVLADKGYTNYADIRKVHDEITSQVYVSLKLNSREQRGLTFTYDATNNVYVCPQGRTLTLYTKHKKERNFYVDCYKCVSCEGCPIRKKCYTGKIQGKTYSRSEHQDFLDYYKALIKTDEIVNLLKKRKTIIEHVFGTIASSMHYNGFRLRGKIKVQTELFIHAISYNLKRLFNIAKPLLNKPMLRMLAAGRDNCVKISKIVCILGSFRSVMISW